VALATHEIDESELVAAVLDKDRKATAEIVGRYGGALHGYLSRRLMPRHDLVDDLFQQVFLEAWQSLDRFRQESGLKAWLLAIARHKVQDYYRSRLRECEWDDSAPEPADTSDLVLDFETQQQRLRIWSLLEEMTEEARTLLLWRYWEGQSAERMAAGTGKTVKAVERALARARDQFRAKWKSETRHG
jgi:RNA polymerase sigma-70 factor (ECF subfamily)